MTKTIDKPKRKYARVKTRGTTVGPLCSTQPTLEAARTQNQTVDAIVGNALRLRRTLLGLSQEKLGEAVDLTFQQIQKYERGSNRIGASRLFQFSIVLGVTPSYFFEKMEGDKDVRKTVLAGGGIDEVFSPEDNELQRRETLEFMRAMERLTTDQRKKIVSLTHTLAGPAPKKGDA